MGRQIVLEYMKLTHFKGIPSSHQVFGHRTVFRGPNESGKTTHNDGWIYTFFDKDSNNKTKFDIMPVDGNHKVMDGLSPEVEVGILVDGKKVVLRKVFSQKWPKKRGSAEKEFTGHKTDYFIDGVPVKQKEFKAYIDSLIDEETFRLLTDVTYFNTQMSWERRRALLLEVCGDVTDMEVIASNEALARLPDILGDRTIEQHRKVIAVRRKDINAELEKIPVRVDEANRSKPDTDGLDQAELKRKIEQFKSKVALKDSEITRLQSGNEITVAENRVKELEGALLAIKNSGSQESVQAVSNQRGVIATIDNKLYNLNTSLDAKRKKIESNREEVRRLEEKAEQLRADWAEKNAEVFHGHIGDTCDACGQSLPAERVAAAHEKALAEFNRRKSEQLESIAKQGTEQVEKVRKLEEANQQLAAEIDELKAQIETVESNVAEEKSRLEELQAQVVDVTKSQEYIAKQEELERAKSRVTALRSSVLEDVERVRKEKMDLSDELSKLETKLSYFGQVDRIDERITELKAQERELAEEFERLEQELYLTEEFIKSKVSLLESKINSMFTHARFQLFSEQVNGAIQETCECLYKGVSYNSTLNTGGKILVGLDIVATLQRHYGISVPVWIDNRESLTEPLPDMDCQVVELVADDKTASLTIETYEREGVLS